MLSNVWWMDGWMDGWLAGWLNRWIGEGKDEWIQCMHGCMEGWAGWMEGWICGEITWNLHFPLELLLSAPFGSSVRKPDLGEGGNCSWLCSSISGTYCSCHNLVVWTQSADLMPSLPALAFVLCPLPHLKGLEWGRECNQQKENKEGLGSDFCYKQICFHLLAPFSISPEPKAFSSETLFLQSVCTVWQSSLTLTVSSGREVAAASFPRATESGYCPRWNSAEMEACIVRVQGEEQGLSRPLRLHFPLLQP